MGREESQQRQAPVIGYLIVVIRVPFGVIGSLVVILLFAGWFVLETAVFLLAFPVAAVITDQAWIQGSWLGRFPISLREFASNRFQYLRAIWNWVTDPRRTIHKSADRAGVDEGTFEATPVQESGGASTFGLFRYLGWIAIGIIVFVVIMGVWGSGWQNTLNQLRQQIGWGR